MREGRKPEYPDKTPGDELQKPLTLTLVLLQLPRVIFSVNQGFHSVLPLETGFFRGRVIPVT